MNDKVKRLSKCRADVPAALLLTLITLNSVQAEDGSEEADKAQRQILNEGYSLFYSATKGMKLIDLSSYVKTETQDVDDVVTAVADYASTLADEIEKLAKAYPAVRIDLKPLPKIEQKTRDLAVKKRLIGLAPLTGRTGPDYERTLLLSIGGGLSQLKTMAEVLADEESVESLSKVFSEAEENYTSLYEQVVKLLNEAYFKHNTYQSGKN